MEQIEFIHSANNKNIVLFIHGFTGGDGTWNRKNLPSFSELLRDEKVIAENFDLAIINYYTTIASLERVKTAYNGIKRVLKLSSEISYKNLGIKELSVPLKSVIDLKCSKYDNIFIVAHSMGGLITKSFLLDELASGSDRVKIFFSLAVPHNGAEVATVAKMFYRGNKQLFDLANNSTVINEINQRWVELYAGLPHTIYFYGLADRMVSKESAVSFQSGKKEIVACPDDHYTISKPVNREALVYVTVKNKLIEYIEDSKELEAQKVPREDTPFEISYDSTVNNKAITERENGYRKLTRPFIYPKVNGYIPRKVIELDKYNPIFALSNSTDLEEPLDALKENKHIVLLSGAGTGKSIEMKHIAHVCSQDSSQYVPILINLNKFVPRSFNEVLSEFWSEWNKVYDNTLILILDGLDEIESHYKKDAIKYIELFVEQHPDVHVIISCRNNFYQSESDHFSGTLQGFKSYLLNPLNQTDIKSYIATVLGPVKSKEFNRIIQHSNLINLIRIPFYLVHIIEMYIKNGTLPNNKSSLFEYLISQGIYNDIDHFKNTIDLSKEEYRLIQSMEIIALSMEDLGRNFLTDEEFSYITDEETKDLLAHSAIWKKIEEDNEIRWQFEHNNFQEFLAARILSRQDIKTIKDFLTFGPDHKKLIPSWLNTLSFLVSVLDSQDSRYVELLEWVINNEPEMLLNFEADRLDEQTRIESFQQIFKNYEEKQVWINRDKFDYQDLAKFASIRANFEFLLDKISQGHYTTRVNALKLLELMQIPITRRTVMGNMLTEIVINNEENTIVRSAALGVLSRHKFKSTDQVELIVSNIRTSTNDSIRTYLYRYIIDCEAVDDYIDVFLEGIQYVGLNRSSDESRLINEKIKLENGLEKATSPVSVSMILSFFKENINNIDHYFLKDQLKVIGTNAAVAYKDDNNVFFAAFNLFKNLQEKYWLKEAFDFSVFFDISQTKKKAIDFLFEKRKLDENNLGAIGLLIDEDAIGFLSQQYIEHELSNDDVWKIQREINSIEYFKIFNERMNEVSNNKFEMQPRRDYEQERRDRLKRDIYLLFNKEAFIEQVNYLYRTEVKESFTQNEIIKSRVNRDEFGFSTLVIDFIYRLAENKPVTCIQVLEVIDSLDWDYFCLSNVYKIMSSTIEISLEKEQVERISNWCIKNVNSFNFKVTCKKTGTDSFSTSNEAIIFWYFLRKYNLKYPQNVLLDMISFDWIEGSQMLGMLYLEQYIDIDTMAERVWENLQNGIELDDILENHIDFCRRHGINDVVSLALAIIVDTNRSISTRSTALKTFIDLTITRDMGRLISSLSKINDNFKWEVIRTLFEKGFGLECEDYLITILNGTLNEREQLQSSKFLIKLQNFEALNFYVQWVERQVKNNVLIEETMPLHDLNAIETLPYVMELLSLSYNEGFRQQKFQRVDSEIRSALTNIALQSTTNFIVVKTELENFIQKNVDFQYINFLNVFIEDLEARYYVTLQKKIRDISDVKERLYSMGLIR